MKLEGQLIGANELENSWRTAISTISGRSHYLDLNAVDHVDGAGKYLLALIARGEAALVASGARMKDLVRAKWPLREQGLRQ